MAVISPRIARHDALGAISLDTARSLTIEPEFRTAILTTRIDVPEPCAHEIKGLANRLLHEAFLASDVLLYRFPIYHPFFDALLVGNGRARQVVRFHNVTPKALVTPETHRLIGRSFNQIQNFKCADEIWADSPENAAELEHQGIRDKAIHIILPAVERPALFSYTDRPASPVRFCTWAASRLRKAFWSSLKRWSLPGPCAQFRLNSISLRTSNSPEPTTSLVLRRRSRRKTRGWSLSRCNFPRRRAATGASTTLVRPAGGREFAGRSRSCPAWGVTKRGRAVRREACPSTRMLERFELG